MINKNKLHNIGQELLSFLRYAHMMTLDFTVDNQMDAYNTLIINSNIVPVDISYGYSVDKSLDWLLTNDLLKNRRFDERLDEFFKIKYSDDDKYNDFFEVRLSARFQQKEIYSITKKSILSLWNSYPLHELFNIEVNVYGSYLIVRFYGKYQVYIDEFKK